VSIRSWSTTGPQNYRPLTIVSQEGYVGDFLGYVRGIVRNDQLAALTNIKILAEIDGNGTDYNISTIERLEPGASAPFNIGFAYPNFGGPYNYTHPVTQGLGQLAP
jgi:hypothetical protein